MKGLTRRRGPIFIRTQKGTSHWWASCCCCAAIHVASRLANVVRQWVRRNFWFCRCFKKYPTFLNVFSCNIHCKIKSCTCWAAVMWAFTASCFCVFSHSRTKYDSITSNDTQPFKNSITTASSQITGKVYYSGTKRRVNVSWLHTIVYKCDSSILGL